MRVFSFPFPLTPCAVCPVPFPPKHRSLAFAPMIPHPGNPSISLWAFPQPFFIECSALLSPVPLFAKLAIPVKSLIKNAALSNQPASLLAAVHARPIRLPFPSLWPCRFRSALFFAIFLLFFSPGRFFMRPGPRPAFCTVCCARVFRAVGAARFSAFFPLFWLLFRCFFVRILHRR